MLYYSAALNVHLLGLTLYNLTYIWMLDWGKGNLTYQPETISDHFINKICVAVGRKDVEAMMWKLKNYQKKISGTKIAKYVAIFGNK